MEHLFIPLDHVLCGNLYAQPSNEDWKEKMMSEKIAYLTTEVGITPEESQTFWPIYNQVNQDKDQAMKSVFRAYKELSQAVEEGRPEKEIQKLLETYLSARQKQREVETTAEGKLQKALPLEKVAKLYIAEERYRRMQIHKLHGGGHKKR